MAYVVVDKKSQTKVTNRNTGVSSYPTLGGARRAATRNNKKNDGREYVAMSDAEYKAQLPKITVKNMMTGIDVVIDADTPLCCDPSSETYWSM